MQAAVCIAIVAPWLLVLILIAALIYGQPAAFDAQRAQISVQATMIAGFRAQIDAFPTPTSRPCRASGPYPYPPYC